MGGIVGLLLCIVLCGSVGGVQGACRRLENDDMIEYLCTSGQLSDLNDLPAETGKIRISNMPIGRITADTFSRFGSDLWVLGCSHCDITDIDPDAFQHLNNLQQLSFDNNHLTTIKKSWFKGLDYLTYLDINYNNIESIEVGVFENLPSLVELRLSGNRLECLNLASMSRLKQLRRIFLTENPEFKCPNAVSAFLESHGVSFEKDADWDRFSTDLISAEVLYDGDTYYEESNTEEPSTQLPIFRERLHLTTTPSPTVTSTVSYVQPKFHTTEEVVYRPYNTPYWRTTPETITAPYDNRPETATLSYDENENTRAPYIPPGTIAPIELEKYQQRETTQYGSQDTTTLSSWPRTSEPTSASNEYPPVYPPHRNEDKHYTEQPDYSRLPNLLALGQDDRHQTMPSYVDFDTKHGPERNTVPSNVEYPPVSIPTVVEYPPISIPSVENRAPEYLVPSVDSSDTTHSIQSIPRGPTAVIQPAHPDNVYQPPYYEPTVTVHSTPLISNQLQQENATPGIEQIETTTDKPLPNCPTRNSSSSNHGTVAIIIVSFVLAVRVLVEGF